MRNVVKAAVVVFFSGGSSSIWQWKLVKNGDGGRRIDFKVGYFSRYSCNFPNVTGQVEEKTKQMKNTRLSFWFYKIYFFLGRKSFWYPMI